MWDKIKMARVPSTTLYVSTLATPVVRYRASAVYRGEVGGFLHVIKGCTYAYAAIVMTPENGIMRWARCGIERLMFRLGHQAFNVDYLVRLRLAVRR